MSVYVEDVEGASSLFPLTGFPQLRMLKVQGTLTHATQRLFITEEASILNTLETLHYDIMGIPMDLISVPIISLRILDINASTLPELTDEGLVHLVNRCAALEQCHIRQMIWPFSCFNFTSSPALTHLSLRFEDRRRRNHSDACLFDSVPSLRHLHLDLGYSDSEAHLLPQQWPSLPLLRSLKIVRGGCSSMAIFRQCPNVIAVDLEHDSDEILGWLGDIPEWRKGAPHAKLRLIRMSRSGFNQPSVLTPGLYARLLERRPSIRIEECASEFSHSEVDSIPDGVHCIILQRDGLIGNLPVTPLLSEEADRLAMIQV